MATEPTNLRLDIDAKKKAFAIFEQVGIKPAQAVNLFLYQVVLQGGLPFEVKVPNAETKEAMEELGNSGRKHYQTSQEMFDDLENEWVI